jgi:regulator of protease activity HflC (stomatin/prohibitin superfamily)
MKQLGYIFTLFLVAILAGCSKVPSGNVGIKVYLLGGAKGVDTETLGVGRYWIGMNEELHIFPTYSQTVTWGAEDDEQIAFQTREGMQVNADIGMTYSIAPDKVPLVFQKYRRGIEEITDVYLRNMVRDALVTVAGGKAVEAVYGEGKSGIIKQVEEIVRSQVAPFGINIERVYWVGAVRLPEQMINALNAKLQATQMAEQRRNEVEQAKAEAQKERERAQGDADAKLTLAKAEAESIKLKAAALRENADVATLNAIEKWDGKLPTYMAQGTPLPFIGVGASK